jgi:lipopolysaccharide transport system ATP-binding protein
MAGDVVIRVERLGKKYIIGHETERERYAALRDVAARVARNVWKRTVDAARGRAIVRGETAEELWALKDVSFEVGRGEVLGIIGRNGAGKSTFLKILSRITEPTEGRVSIAGRVASLLEVGTGFHPELTGRENIYLNGAILGMRRAEIRRKFDEIVEFADIARFLDTPVKHFSSGMYVRLAFAVAAHLESEILIVDEVLAVGDTEFQRKCLGKMSEISDGRTVLFVSHNLDSIETLCTRAIYLAEGRVVQEGSTSDVIATYLGKRDLRLRRGAVKIGAKLELTEITVNPSEVRTGELVTFQLTFAASERGVMRECALHIHSAKGVRVADLDLRQLRYFPLRYREGYFSFGVRVPNLSLIEGDYTIGIYLVTDEYRADLVELAEFDVRGSLIRQDFTPYPASVRGFVSLEFKSAGPVSEHGLPVISADNHR